MLRLARYWLSTTLLALGPTASRAQPESTLPEPMPIVDAMSFPSFRPDPNSSLSPSSGTDLAASNRLPKNLISTLESLGASSGVPDGLGASWYPTQPVRNQPAHLGMNSTQVGITEPVYHTDTDWFFANGAARLLSIRSDAILRDDRVRIPSQFWDVQAGGAVVHQMGGGYNWGAFLNVGSQSDKPFHSIHEMTVSALAFFRLPQSDTDAWLFYVVSTTAGQFGHNLPIPGLAYEFDAGKLRGIVGFPFITLNYKPVKELEYEFVYAALTDVLIRANYKPFTPFRIFAGFEWLNQAWFRADRVQLRDQTFYYEKQVFTGVGWMFTPQADLRINGGYGFDRYFVDNAGFSLSGRNRVDVGAGPFVSAQFEFRY